MRAVLTRYTRSMTWWALAVVERLGNRLPHPSVLFVLIAVAVAALSSVASLAGLHVTDPADGRDVAIRSLVSPEGVTFALTSMLDNFLSFPPLGLVIVMLLGAGLASEVGLLETGFRFAVLRCSSPRMVTTAVILVGICSNIASESAAIVIPPLAAMLFAAGGRHPLAGLAAGFGAVGAGFSANVIIAGTDVLLSGITTKAAGIVAPGETVTPLSNWYFMAVSTLVLTVVGVVVTEKVVEPRLGEYSGPGTAGVQEIGPDEKRALRNAALAGVLYAVAVVVAVLPAGSPLRGDGGSLVDSPFLDAIVPILFLFFVVTATVYGVGVGKIRSASDVPQLMTTSAKDLPGLLVLIFVVAQTIAYFEWTHLGTWVAVGGSDLMRTIGLGEIGGLVLVSLVTLLLSLIIASGSALWSIMAPVFVPMMMLNGIDPAYTQLAYRIADSSTNMLVPLSPILAVALAYVQRYDKRAGIGTVYALMIPYAVAFYLVWITLFVVWTGAGLPIGPGESLRPGN